MNIKKEHSGAEDNMHKGKDMGMRSVSTHTKSPLCKKGSYGGGNESRWGERAVSCQEWAKEGNVVVPFAI